LGNIHLDIGSVVVVDDRIERRLKLHDVRVLMSVVEAGSMHKAAERLATSQPAISRAIADLEHALGVRLLDRSPTGIRPTQYGHAIIQRGLAVFDELRQGVKDIEFLSDPTSGELRVGCSEYAAGGPVLAVIERLTRRHPRMVFDVVTGPVLTLYRDLTERKIELVITRLVEFADRENMMVESLFDDDIVAVAAVQNPWTRRKRIELVELHLDAAWQTLGAQGFACRIGQCAWDDRDHHLEESNAQPARRAIHQDHTCCREAAGEGEMITTAYGPKPTSFGHGGASASRANSDIAGTGCHFRV
jgi:DNA-binding transcriptional LysR family regulator